MDFDQPVPSNPIIVAAPPGPAADLLSYRLDQLSHITVCRLPVGEASEGWRGGRFLCALIPPLDFFQQVEGRLIPGIGLIAAEDARTECLFYRDDLETVRRVAVSPDAEPLIHLAKLLVREIAGATPEFVPMGRHTLESSDGYLASGLDTALAEVPFSHRFDLQAVWHDHFKTALPLLVWAVAQRAPFAELRRRLGRACQLGIADADAIGTTYDQARRLPPGSTCRYLTERSRFGLGSSEAAGLRELLRLAHRHDAAHPAAAVRFC